MLQFFYRLLITNLVITVLFARLIATSVVKFIALMLVSYCALIRERGTSILNLKNTRGFK